jgi:hypothetical protein
MVPFGMKRLFATEKLNLCQALPMFLYAWDRRNAHALPVPF